MSCEGLFWKGMCKSSKYKIKKDTISLVQVQYVSTNKKDKFKRSANLKTKNNSWILHLACSVRFKVRKIIIIMIIIHAKYWRWRS